MRQERNHYHSNHHHCTVTSNMAIRNDDPKMRQVEWEERWWEASDWAGMKEMGAEKSGCTAAGAAWRETWREAIAFDQATGEPLVERSAHKWAHTEKVDPAGGHCWLCHSFFTSRC